LSILGNSGSVLHGFRVDTFDAFRDRDLDTRNFFDNNLLRHSVKHEGTPAKPKFHLPICRKYLLALEFG